MSLLKKVLHGKWFFNSLVGLEKGPQKKKELDDLCELITNLGLQDGKDSRIFCIYSSNGFSVKELRKHITTNNIGNHIHGSNNNMPIHKWNSILPIKVNVFFVACCSWAPTDKIEPRQIDFPSVRRPCCDEDLESDTHLFIGCRVAKKLWEIIFRWWNISPPHLHHLKDVFISEGSKKFLEIVMPLHFGFVGDIGVMLLSSPRLDQVTQQVIMLSFSHLLGYPLDV